MLTDKKIIIGMTGGIAAYKIAEFVRLLRQQNAEIRVVMTAAAKEFITPLTLQALSGNPVHDNLLDCEAEMGMGHIELARWADLIIIAPASADFISRLAHGRASDLLSALCLATKTPIAIAPAMNVNMWENPATQANIQLLKQRFIDDIGPQSGSQACGDIGYGRMSEPSDLMDYALMHFQKKQLKGMHVLITAGPTQEAIDPVRFISNYSSGKMGYSLAQACSQAGAKVTLISGPVNIPSPQSVKILPVISAQEMFSAVMQQIENCDIFISTAAVADYRPIDIAAQKIKKTTQQLAINLIKNPDIVAEVGKLKNKPFIVGFAAETENVSENAQKKLINKNLDLIVANEVGNGKGFNTDINKLIVFDASLKEYDLGEDKKIILAKKLVELIAEKIKNKK